MTMLSRLKRKSLTVLASLAALLVAVGAAFALVDRSVAPAEVAPSRQVVRTLQSPPANSSTDEHYLGVILARQAVDITARWDGRVQQIPVRLGDTVGSGDRLATLDVASLRPELAAAQALVREAKMEQRRVIIELSAAKQLFERRLRLTAHGLATGEELEKARYQHELTITGLEIVRAQVQQREARLEQIRQTMADAEIRAPFRGMIAGRYVDPGATISRSTPIVRLISADDLFVRFAVPEEIAHRLTATSRIEVMSTRGKLVGSVEKVAPEIDAASRLVHVEAGIEKMDNARGRHLSGETVRLKVAP